MGRLGEDNKDQSPMLLENGFVFWKGTGYKESLSHMLCIRLTEEPRTDLSGQTHKLQILHLLNDNSFDLAKLL